MIFKVDEFKEYFEKLQGNCYKRYDICDVNLVN